MQNVEDSFKISVELHSSEAAGPVVKLLYFPSLPTTFREIKQKIEECCSVPTCVQSLQYQSVEVPDNCSPSSIYMRSGDTLKVSFPQYGECEKVREAVQWLCDISSALDEFKKGTTESELRLLYNKHSKTINNENSNILTCELFSPWEKTQRVNCSHFMALEGAKLLINVHRDVIKLRNEESRTLRYLTTFFEVICCQAITNFAMDFECRRHILECGGLEQCIQSFLIKPANEESLNFNYSHEIVSLASYALCNITEVPEVQVLLSANTEVIRQIFLIGECSTYTCKTVEIAVGILICMTQSPEAHVNLTKPDIFDDLIKICVFQRDRQNLDGSGNMEVKALEYYAALILSQMVCGSPHLLQNFPKECLQNAIVHMDKVLSYPPEAIRAHELEAEIVWRTFEPVISFLYSPYSDKTPSNQDVLIKQLYDRATKVLLHFLESSLGRQDHVNSFVEENLLDFVVALSWIVPSECQEKARKVCEQIKKFMWIQPPTLTSLTLAKLAKLKWGFRRVREVVSVPQLLLQIT